EPVEGATVRAEWLEITIARNAFARRIARVSVITSPQGWFALCDVPRGGEVVLRAMQNGDSTDMLDVRVPATGLLRRELYLGAGVGRLRGAVRRSVSAE